MQNSYFIVGTKPTKDLINRNHLQTTTICKIFSHENGWAAFDKSGNIIIESDHISLVKQLVDCQENDIHIINSSFGAYVDYIGRTNLINTDTVVSSVEKFNQMVDDKKLARNAASNKRRNERHALNDYVNGIMSTRFTIEPYDITVRFDTKNLMCVGGRHHHVSRGDVIYIAVDGDGKVFWSETEPFLPDNKPDCDFWGTHNSKFGTIKELNMVIEKWQYMKHKITIR